MRWVRGVGQQQAIESRVVGGLRNFSSAGFADFGRISHAGHLTWGASALKDLLLCVVLYNEGISNI